MDGLSGMIRIACRRLLLSRGGNVTMLFGLSLIPLIGAIGAAIDYSQAARSRTHITQAANVAALASARIAQNYMNLNGTGSAQFTIAKQLAQTEMSQVFAANQASDKYTQNATPVLAMTQASDGSAIATVTATGSAPTTFMKILGISTVPVATLAQAQGGAPKYYQIVFLVDISNSMGIGGTPADITKLSNDKLIQCAFACHDANNQRADTYSAWCKSNSTDENCHTSGPSYCPSRSNYPNGNSGTNQYNTNCATRTDTGTPYADKRALAKKYSYKLKIDYINSAISTFITQLQPYMTQKPDLFRVAIYTYGTATSSTPIFPTGSTVTPGTGTISTYITQLQAAATGIDLETAVPSGQNYGYTYTTLGLQKALSGMQSIIGDGSTANNRKTYFILLSDGAQDVPGSSAWGRVVDVNYTTACTAVKQPVDAGNSASNPVIFSIEAAYPPVPDSQYTTLISGKGLDTGIPSAMKACATASSDYFLATDGPAIQSAVSQVFSNIVGSDLHLSR